MSTTHTTRKRFFELALLILVTACDAAEGHGAEQKDAGAMMDARVATPSPNRSGTRSEQPDAGSRLEIQGFNNVEQDALVGPDFDLAAIVITATNSREVRGGGSAGQDMNGPLLSIDSSGNVYVLPNNRLLESVSSTVSMPRAIAPKA